MADKSSIKRFLIGISKTSFTLAVVAFVLSVIDLGFRLERQTDTLFLWLYNVAILVCLVSLVTRLYWKRDRMHPKIVAIDLFLSVFLVVVLVQNIVIVFAQGIVGLHNLWTYLALFLVFIREIYNINFHFKYKAINPAQLFAGSFFIVILMGSLLLMLPNATRGEIAYLDALFTATSAVCVTGLTVVDTGTVYTFIGQTIILFLIQIGGLGIMTFASYFSYFFKSGSSYENQMYMGEMTNVDRLDDVFGTLKKIILVTFTIEGLGALLLFSSIRSEIVPGIGHRLFFSVFHAVSGFCNAGFSPLKDNLFDIAFRYNYFFQLVIAFLIIFGGIGFPIIFNMYQFFVYKIGNLFKRLVHAREKTYLPWVLNINSKIVIITTAILIFGGTAVFMLFEYNNTLAEHGFWGKIVIAFASSVTTRTAGFNSLDMSIISPPVALVFIVLMWIGASPASTGGGVKTSAFAVACLNVVSLVRGKKNLEVFGREVSQISIQRASAAIILSIFTLFVSIFFVTLFDPEKSLLNVVFECVSAFGTVGLSRGITASLTDASKVVIILTMFIGRVSLFTLIVAFIKKARNSNYRYPAEDLLIN